MLDSVINYEVIKKEIFRILERIISSIWRDLLPKFGKHLTSDFKVFFPDLREHFSQN